MDEPQPDTPAPGRETTSGAASGPVPAARTPVVGDPPVHTRRWVLGGVLAALAAGGAGVLAGVRPDRHAPRPKANPPPATLVAAAAVEATLIADLDATSGGAFAVRRVIVAARADHAAHLATLRGLLARYDAVPGATSASVSGRASASVSGGRTPALPPGRPRTRAQLRAAEREAAAAGARRASALGGATGALLASISACESTHAELLS